MSALQLPARPRTPPARRHLRLVEAPASSLAPSGPLQAWRRRIGALLLLVALVAIVVEVLSGPTAGVEQPATVPVSVSTVVVQPGETLWDVAAAHAPAGTSEDAFVAEVVELNGLSTASVNAWQVLRLPS